MVSTKSHFCKGSNHICAFESIIVSQSSSALFAQKGDEKRAENSLTDCMLHGILLSVLPSTFIAMERFFGSATSASSAATPAGSASRGGTASTVAQTYEEAINSGTLRVTEQGVTCQCTPSKRYAPGWGPRTCEWKTHSSRDKHQNWVRSQRGKRSLTTQCSAPPSGNEPSAPNLARPSRLNASRSFPSWRVLPRRCDDLVRDGAS